MKGMVTTVLNAQERVFVNISRVKAVVPSAVKLPPKKRKPKKRRTPSVDTVKQRTATTVKNAQVKGYVSICDNVAGDWRVVEQMFASMVGRRHSVKIVSLAHKLFDSS